MNRYLIVVLGFVAVLGCLAVATSEAEDFTFTVPVALASLHPEVTRVDVVCTATVDEAGNVAVGEGQTTVPLDGSGNYTGNVVVKFNHVGSSDPALAKRYRCRLLVWAGNQGTVPSANASHVARRSKEGTTLTATVSGAIPN